jgi:hypothetical protein
MSSALSIIREALSTKSAGLAVVTAVDGFSVRLATSNGAADAVSTTRLSVGDKVTVANGIATLVPVASIVEAV